VRDCYETWSLRRREPHVRRSRERDYKQHFTAYILPALGDEALRELRLGQLVQLRDALTDRGISRKMVRNGLASSLNAMLRKAPIQGLATPSPRPIPRASAGAGYFQPNPFTPD
jgi:hypothetical protein